MKGIVVSFNKMKGYGFVSVSLTEQYFLHITEIKEAQTADPVGCLVEFDVAEGRGRLRRATNVRILTPVATTGASNE